jgi:hypothetical protein
MKGVINMQNQINDTEYIISVRKKLNANANTALVNKETDVEDQTEEVTQFLLLTLAPSPDNDNAVQSHLTSSIRMHELPQIFTSILQWIGHLTDDCSMLEKNMHYLLLEAYKLRDAVRLAEFTADVLFEASNVPKTGGAPHAPGEDPLAEIVERLKRRGQSNG